MKRVTKVLLICSLFGMLTASNLFAKEKETVDIRINGEEYTQDMPADLKSAQSLILYLADMVNNSDDYIVRQNKQNAEDRQSYIKKIEELETKLDEAEKALGKADTEVSNVEKGVDKLTKINTRFTPFFMVGPVIGTDKNIGAHISFGGIYRIFGNLQIGGSLFSSVYSDSSRNLDLGLGLMVAWSIY